MKNGIIAIFETCVKLCFTVLHSAVFGKVRILIGEIKYAFAHEFYYSLCRKKQLMKMSKPSTSAKWKNNQKVMRFETLRQTLLLQYLARFKILDLCCL